MFLKLKSPLFVFVLFISTQLMAQDGGLKILKTIKLADDNRWDFLTVDAKNQRLFLSHQTKVLVIDIKTEKIITEIDNTAGVHGIALAPELNKGFISCGESASVVMFD